VFLQSDVLDAVAAMRDEFEQHAGDVLELAPLHSTAPVFHWTAEQEYAALAAAAGVQPASQQLQQQHQQQKHEASCVDAAGGRTDDSGSSTSSSTHDSTGGSTSGSSSEEPQAEDDIMEGVSDYMSEAGSDSEAFESTWAAGGWLVDNPLGVPTERENYVLSQGGKVFRVLLVRRE
jgi:hypothetical protein